LVIKLKTTKTSCSGILTLPQTFLLPENVFGITKRSSRNKDNSIRKIWRISLTI